jgi:3-oxoacyl-[acyl-carrier protein] reductase
MGDFTDKTIVITGASRGVGRQLAIDFAGEGANIVATDVMADADALLEEVGAAGGKGLYCRADVSVSADVAGMLESALSAFGRIDVLVNNAGVNIDSPFLDIAEDDWDRVIAVNLKGPFLCTQIFGRAMAATGGGSIVNISAVTGTVARRNGANYCASKAGLDMLTKCAALELGPRVRVNGLALGFFDSPLVRELYSSDQVSAIVGETPLNRTGEFGEVSAAVKFLASDAASFITGQTPIIDGGRIMR